MNAWNPEFVRASYEKQSLGFLTHIDGKTRLQPSVVANVFRSLVFEHGYDPNNQKTLEKARIQSQGIKPGIPYETLNWLSFTMMLSEVGKQKELDDLLEYADSRLKPTWVNGGLYYPRNQQLMDKDWNYTHVEPHSGNSGIGYARLNVPDGQRKMWKQPWTRQDLGARPWVDGDAFDDDVDFLRGIWDADKSAVVVTLRRWRGEPRSLTLHIKNLPVGQWDVFANGVHKTTDSVPDKGRVVVIEEVGMEELDIVVQRSAS